MTVKFGTYGGRLGWWLRVHFSKYTSWAYLESEYQLRKRLYKKYINAFDKYQESKREMWLPCLISIETINRCNSTCDFCPVNVNVETRPFQKMDEALFHKIIRELAEEGYDGYLNLYINNEPFMDMRIIEWYKFAKTNLPKAKMLLYTNGLLLTEERFEKIIPYIDKMVINNYSEKLSLHNNIKAILDLCNSKEKYKCKDISIQIRYIHEILTNRAGNAPNKNKGRRIHKICILPYTDLSIYPDGTVGICCNDALEKTNLGNVTNRSLREIWESDIYKKLRKQLSSDRSTVKFCACCDFIDAGIRNSFMKERLRINRK